MEEALKYDIKAEEDMIEQVITASRSKHNTHTEPDCNFTGQALFFAEVHKF